MSSYHEYVNLDITNNSTSPVLLRFSQNRNIPFLKDCKDYVCSIVRASVQTGMSLPVFIPDIQLGQSDVNQTTYAITFCFMQNVSINKRSTYAVFLQNSKCIIHPQRCITTNTISTNYRPRYIINLLLHVLH